MSDRKQIHALTHQEGQSFWMLGTLITLKASAETTNGTFSLIEQVAPPGFATPLHVHHAEDLAFYVLEGEITFFGGGETIHASVGTYVYLPRDLPWSFRVDGSMPTRLLQWTYPAGLENFFVEMGVPTNDLTLPPPASPDGMQQGIQKLLALDPKYHMETLGPPPGAEIP